jgi:competence protein ComGF
MLQLLRTLNTLLLDMLQILNTLLFSSLERHELDSIRTGEGVIFGDAAVAGEGSSWVCLDPDLNC